MGRTDSIHGRRALRYRHRADCETTIEPEFRLRSFVLQISGFFPPAPLTTLLPSPCSRVTRGGGGTSDLIAGSFADSVYNE